MNAIAKNEKLVAEFPAYIIVERAPIQWGEFEGCVEIKADESLGLDSKRGYFAEFNAGSVVSYAMKNGDDPLEAISKEAQRGHKLHWINACGSMITAHSRAQEKFVKVEIGMLVKFEGRKFKIVAAPNNNLDLQEVPRIQTLGELLGDPPNQ